MSEYILRESVMEFPIRRTNYDRKNGNAHFINGVETVLEYVENLPSVDVAQVVRCKNCIHYGLGVCLKIYLDGRAAKYSWQFRNPDDFCSYGELKMVGEEAQK